MDKKITPQEAAKAVLKKAEELLKSSKMAKCGMLSPEKMDKSDKGVHSANHEGPGRSAAGSFSSAAVQGNTSLPKSKLNAAAKDEHKEKLAELKAMPKPNLTKIEGAPAEQNVTPHDGVVAEPDAAAPHGTQNPDGHGNGVHKLAKFMGRREEKAKKHAAPPPEAPAVPAGPKDVAAPAAPAKDES